MMVACTPPHTTGMPSAFTRRDALITGRSCGPVMVLKPTKSGRARSTSRMNSSTYDSVSWNRRTPKPALSSASATYMMPNGGYRSRSLRKFIRKMSGLCEGIQHLLVKAPRTLAEFFAFGQLARAMIADKPQACNLRVGHQFLVVVQMIIHFASGRQQRNLVD